MAVRKTKRSNRMKKLVLMRSSLVLVFILLVSVYIIFFNDTLNDTSSSTLSVEFLDVGQGDCILITCDGRNMLIDGGDNDKGTTVQLALEKRDITYLDYIIGTHAHADHYGGLDVIITKFDCGKIILSPKKTDTRTCEDVYNAIKYRNYKVTEPVTGDRYKLGDAVFTILSPGNNNYGDELNNYSVSVLLEHEGRRFLFTGDSEERAERDIVETGLLSEVDVLKAGHHGSSTSNSELLLDTIFTNGNKDYYAVISCGEGNPYGHPHAEALNSFRKRGISVFRTDEQGSIKIISENGKLTFNCSPSDTWKNGD